MPIVEADLRAALRVQAFEIVVGEPREILVAGYEPRAAGLIRGTAGPRGSIATSSAARSTRTSASGDVTTERRCRRR